MRGFERNRARAEEEESVFVTMTDMTISFLLIIMILLAFFATQLDDDDTVTLSAYESVRDERDDLRSSVETLKARLAVIIAERDELRGELLGLREENDALRVRIEELGQENDQLAEEIERLLEQEAELARVSSELAVITAERDEFRGEFLRLREENDALRVRIAELEEENPLEAYLFEAKEQRDAILEQLRTRLLIEFPELEEVISIERDALRFQGEGLFQSGSSQLQPRQREIVSTMGQLLDEILVCFTLGERAVRVPDCESGNAIIEAVQVEGHTDSDGSDRSNLHLSTDRANATLLVMLDEESSILAHRNLRGQPVMSVSGYGEMRPIETNETTDGKAANRRIDLRIIMYAPSTVEDMRKVGRQLDALRALGGPQ